MIRVENINVTLGNFSLDNVTLTVNPGECVVLLGPTGNGKTVLLETIAGIYRPKTGRILINGIDVTRQRPKKRGLGVVYQDYALFPHMTVFDNIAFGLKARRTGTKKTVKRVNRMAGFLDIEGLLRRKPDRLSGGEQQRCAIARALVTNPHALLLDEPFSALDSATRNRLRQEIKNIHKKLGITLLNITHDMTDAFFLADRMAILKDGALLQADTPENILSQPASRTVARLVGIDNILEGRVSGNGLETKLGRIAFPIKNNWTDGIRAWIGIPDWAVHLFPSEKKDEYLWTGKMRVRQIDFTDHMIRIRLSLENGAVLQTRLSRREAAALPLRLEPGALVPVGIHENGTSFHLS